MDVIIRFESIKSYKEINLLFYILNFNELIRFFFVLLLTITFLWYV